VARSAYWTLDLLFGRDISVIQTVTASDRD
jgi:hypothetical protein